MSSTYVLLFISIVTIEYSSHSQSVLIFGSSNINGCIRSVYPVILLIRTTNIKNLHIVCYKLVFYIGTLRHFATDMPYYFDFGSHTMVKSEEVPDIQKIRTSRKFLSSLLYVKLEFHGQFFQGM